MDSYKKKISLISHPGNEIKDHKTTTSEITVEESGLIEAISIKITVEHGWLHDLIIILTSPNGKEVELRRHVGVDNREHPHQVMEYTLDNKSTLSTFKGEDCKGKWVLTIMDKSNRDEGTLTEWILNFDIIKRNGVHLTDGGYITIPKNDRYLFGNGAFSIMAYICPKKVVNGTTVLQEGTIVSSKSKEGSDGNGGWQFFLEKEGEDLMLCFKTDDGHGYHLLKAPLNNLYDDKKRRLKDSRLVAADIERSKKLYKEYTHFVAAVRDTHGGMNLYVNGYLLARATPFSTSGETMALRSFQLKGIYKQSIDNPTHFFTLKKDEYDCTVGISDWDSDDFHQVGSGFRLISSASSSSNNTNLPNAQAGVTSINSEIANVKPASNMLNADMVSLHITTSAGNKKLLAQFAASSAAKENVNGQVGVRIGSIEQYTHPYEGYISHVSLWSTGLTQNEIIQYMDSLDSEEQNPSCVGFWKLEHDLQDSTGFKNHASIPSGLSDKAKHVYEPQVLPVYMEEQDERNWCWAATALSILEYYNPLSKFLQLDIVKTQHGFNLNQGGFSNKYLIGNSPYANRFYDRPRLWESRKVHFPNPTEFIDKFSMEKLDFNTLEKEINNGNPVCVAVRWLEGGGHIMTLTGIRKKNPDTPVVNANEDFDLIVNDPWSGIIYISTKNFIEQKYLSSKGGWYQTITTRTIDHVISPGENWVSMGAGEDNHYKLTFDSSNKMILRKASVADLKAHNYEVNWDASEHYSEQKKTAFGVNKIEISKKGEITLFKSNDTEVKISKTVPPENRPASLGLQVTNGGGSETWDVGVKDRDGRLVYSIKEELGWDEPAA